jgi:hypothetical protein
VGVPIVVDGRVWGLATVGSTRPEPLPPDTEERMADFADLVATALGQRRYRDELIASRARVVAAADDARRRLERDLHDGAQQRLVSLGLQLRLAEGCVPPELQPRKEQLSGVVSGLTAVSSELQQISRGINPALAPRSDPTRSLRWPVFADRSSLARLSPAPRRFQLGPLVLHGRVLPDDRVCEWLPGWRPDEPLGDGDERAWVGLRSDSGDVFLPFDPDEVVTNLWREGYQVRADGAPGLAAALGGARAGYHLLPPLIPRPAQISVRRLYSRVQARTPFPHWPAEPSLHGFYDRVLAGRPRSPVMRSRAWRRGRPAGPGRSSLRTTSRRTRGCAGRRSYGTSSWPRGSGRRRPTALVTPWPRCPSSTTPRTRTPIRSSRSRAAAAVGCPTSTARSWSCRSPCRRITRCS